MSNMTYLAGLNEKQYEAVTSPLGNILVLAGAGSGKTRVLVTRIAFLIEEKHYSPYDILAVTFTNKAAGEMKARLGTMLHQPLSGLWIGTFHSICHRLLRIHHKEARLPEQFHILDSEDQARLIKKVIVSLNLNIEQWPAKKAQQFINSHKDEGLRPAHINVLEYGSTKTYVAIYKAYEQACQISGLIDFAELLLRTYELLQQNPDILAYYAKRFQAILVDEFQDTNAIQYAWITLLAGQQASVLVVGDDDQSIYGWRGAKATNIQQFLKDFDAQTVRLEQNYRSTATILNAANQLITHNNSRMGKDLWTDGSEGEKILLYSAYNELDEARFISERIMMKLNQGTSKNEIAILYRSNAQSRVIEEALLRAGIAYRIYGGVRFFDRTEIKDTLAYLRLLANSDDDSAFERIVNVPPRGIGEKTLDEVRQQAKTESCSLWNAAKNLIENSKISQRVSASLARFIDLIEDFKINLQYKELEDQIATVIQVSGLHAYFSKAEKAEARLDNLQELVNAAKQFKDENKEEELPFISSFLAHATLESGELQAPEYESYVHLMTLHSAKGLEFPIVFLAGIEEGVFPSKQSVGDLPRLEEERRLCYVGMTRAMHQLILSYANVRRQYGKEEYHRPSRFLAEMPSELVEEVRAKTQVRSPMASRSQSSVQEECLGMRLGQNVVHATFGRGIVLATEGSGAHARVQVKFEQQGTKWLVLAYANLIV